MRTVQFRRGKAPPFTVELSADGSHIVATVFADMSRERANEITVENRKLSDETGVRCLLIDCTQSLNTMDVMNNVHFATDDLPEVMPPDRCYAVLVHPGDHSHDFYVAFARSSGIDISLFWDRAAAISHLREAAQHLNAPRAD